MQSKAPSMVLQHEPGEKLFVDFAGKKLSYVDIETGEIIECLVFVVCLPYSDYCSRHLDVDITLIYKIKKGGNQPPFVINPIY